jgi:hypothetical protein
VDRKPVKRSASAIAIEEEYTITSPTEASSSADHSRAGSRLESRRAGL